MDVVATPVATVDQKLPVKPIWQSKTVQALITGLLAGAGVLAVSVDQLVGLLTANGQYIPQEWMAPTLTGLSIVGIACKWIAMQKRLAVGDLVTSSSKVQ